MVPSLSWQLLVQLLHPVLVLLQKLLLMLMLMSWVQHCEPLLLPFCASHRRADLQSMGLE